MEPEEREEAKNNKKLSDDVVVFMRKRSETEAPRYTARLGNYLDLQLKRRRADAARQRVEGGAQRGSKVPKRKPEGTNAAAEMPENVGDDDTRIRRRQRSLSGSRTRSDGLCDACGCRRKRRRKRSCGRRRRRRRRSCGRRRRRRRSRSRRRRRRSCRRRRRRRRRRRC